MKVKKIYFDMDGVLADFNRGIEELCGMKWGPQDEQGEESIILMWSRAGKIPHFYDRLELKPGAKEMFDAVYERYGTRCEILSAIPQPLRGMVGSAEDKKAWVKRLLSPDVTVNTVYREEKRDFCTGKDCILIDDLRMNAEAWEALGGTAILHRTAEETLQKLKEMEIL